MILFGASGHGKVVLDILLNLQTKIDFFVDDNPYLQEIFGVPVVRNTEDFPNNQVIITIGNNATRKKISEKYSFDYQTAIHPNAVCSKFCNINEGTVVMANAAINAGAKIGRHCIINTGSTIEHDCDIHDFVHVSPNAALAGNVTVKEGTHIGIGASIIQGVTIGKWAVVGAGAVIIRDVPDYATVVGNPGKIIKIN